MSQVGMPGFGIFKRTIRAQPNPLDKSTVISIYPRPIDETKPTLQPGNFKIAPGSYEQPAILVVGSSSWWKELDEDQPLLEIPVSSILIADSIVKDYCNGLLGSNVTTIKPGLFFIPGEWNVERIKKEHKKELDDALACQKRWYEALIKIADIMWSRSNGNPLSVGDDMRLAARELGKDNKEWVKDFQAVELVRCKACQVLNQSTVIVCPNCKVILNPEEFKRLNFQFAS